MAVTTTKTNKPLNPRGNDQSPKGYNRAELYSGKALDFDGVNDHITITNSDSINITGDALTIAGYINTDGSTAWQGICYKDSGNIKGYQLFVDKSGDPNIAFGIHTGTFYRLYSNEVIENNKWYFVVATYDGVNQSIYINGVFDNSQAVTGNITDSSLYNLYIGRNNAGSERFDGEIGGFKIFNTALTAAQVADLYNNPEKIVPTGVADSALKLWLPMQEGAGTTAYDGSGNGNHGTISGATWTHGIGAPVAQTAVIDWNKGRNLLEQTNDIAGSSYWNKTGVTTTADQEDPVGGTDAVKVVTSNATNHQLFNRHTIATACVLSVYVKTDEPAAYLAAYSNNFAVYFDLANETTSSVVGSGVSGDIETFGDWYRITAYFPAVSVEIQIGFLDAVYSGSSTGPWGISTAVGTTGYVAFPSLTSGTTKSPYIPNLTTSPMSVDVLLPQGLTTGRDITGVNLFENVRKQGALNLDNKSFSTIHDNGSLDITTAISVEAWVYIPNGQASFPMLICKKPINSAYLLFIDTAAQKIMFRVKPSGSYEDVTDTDTFSYNTWIHVVGTMTATNMSLYINGVNKVSTAKTGLSISTTAEDLSISHELTNEFKGQIAQPRIYNRALTAEEVERNYNAGKNIYK